MNVPAERPAVRLIFDQDGLKSALVEEPDASVASIETSGVPRVQVVHPSRKIGVRSLKEEVKMVVH